MASIKDLPINERPREKGIMYGIDTLSDAELIAIIISVGCRNKSAVEVSNELIVRFGGLRKLFNSTYEELRTIDGLNSAKAMKLLACFDLVKRISEREFQEVTKFNNKVHIARYFFQKCRCEKREIVYLMMLNYQNYLVSIQGIYKGTKKEVTINEDEIKEICKEKKACKCYLIHNHPSGIFMPSMQDYELTAKTKIYLMQNKIDLIDHIIVSKRGAYSIGESKEINLLDFD